jgi:hypothetical protein
MGSIDGSNCMRDESVSASVMEFDRRLKDYGGGRAAMRVRTILGPFQSHRTRRLPRPRVSGVARWPS